MAANLSVISGRTAPGSLEEQPQDRPSDLISQQEDMVENLVRGRQGGPDPWSERARLEMELEKVRKQLDSQIAASRVARDTATNAIGQLKSVEFESQMVRMELDRTRQQLGQAHQLHAELTRDVAAREQRFNRDLVAARTEAAKAPASTGTKLKFLAIPMVSLFALGWAAVMQWHLLDSQGGLRSRADDKTPPAHSAAAASPSGAASGGQPDLVDAMARLDRAMERFGTAKPEDVLRLVHKQGLARGVNVCSFAWSNGQVSLLFGSKNEEDMPTAIMHCAEAVENTSR